MVAVKHVVAAALAGVACTLAGCGTFSSSGSAGPANNSSGAPGATGNGPSCPSGPSNCPADLARGHCCACDGKTCKACAPPYTLNPSASPDKPDEQCIFDCKSFKVAPTPSKPSSPQDHNGKDWPGMCFDESASHFFTIGDWGGMCDWTGACTEGQVSSVCAGSYSGSAVAGKPCPMPNRNPRSAIKADIEGKVQMAVSDQMLAQYKKLDSAGTPPRFVLNVGDNFYPGGINTHCGKSDVSFNMTQFNQVWKNIYPDPLTSMQWMGVLGNHDYGGVCYLKGWDQQIFYTWNSDNKWVIPAQYWSRSVQYKTFNVQMWFIDGNIYDAVQDTDPNHNICQIGKNCKMESFPAPNGNAEGTCGTEGPTDPDNCKTWFTDLWGNIYKWLNDQVPKSTADWQILINHYPATFQQGIGDTQIDFKTWIAPMGVDLYISGHTHLQSITYNGTGTTPMIITGGGGGVTSEIVPTDDGNDDSYGYMDMEISLNQLSISTYSWTGKLRKQTNSTPVSRKTNQELVQLGLLKPEQIPIMDEVVV